MIKNEIVNRGIDYIIGHLEENISIEDVADHCNFSKYYYSRIFKEETGVSLYAFIKRMKMNQSAIRIQIEAGRSITDIGLDYGYDVTNYSLAFKKQHTLSPSKYRQAKSGEYIQNPFYEDKFSGFPEYEEYQNKIVICNMEDTEVVYERYIGTYVDLGEKWKTFIKKYQTIMQDNTLVIERAYDDPSITDLSQCIYDMCITVGPPCNFDNVTTLTGGTYAVYPFKGAVDEIYRAVQGMIHNWLPKSGYEMDARHALNIYRAMDMENMYVELDVYIPVQKGKNS